MWRAAMYCAKEPVENWTVIGPFAFDGAVEIALVCGNIIARRNMKKKVWPMENATYTSPTTYYYHTPPEARCRLGLSWWN